MNAVSVDQWAFQFKLWSTIRDDQICRFTSDSKERFRGNAGLVVTTYSMVAFGGKRSEESEKIIEEMRNREWGLLLMDEEYHNNIGDLDGQEEKKRGQVLTCDGLHAPDGLTVTCAGIASLSLLYLLILNLLLSQLLPFLVVIF